MDGQLECLVLAGGTPEPSHPLYGDCRGAPKALLEVAGRPMVQWVLEALGEANTISRVILVGLNEDAPVDYPAELTHVPGGGSWTDNFFAGLEHLDCRPGRLAAFCWSDIPLMDAPMVDSFVAAVGDSPRLVHAGLVGRSALESRFGPLDEPYLRLREGKFVAADFGVFQPAAAAPLRPQLEMLAPQRKSAWRQARSVGWGLLVRYLLGHLTIPDFERHLTRAYDISCRIHILEDAEMALDVDGPENLELCRQELAQRERRARL